MQIQDYLSCFNDGRSETPACNVVFRLVIAFTETHAFGNKHRSQRKSKNSPTEVIHFFEMDYLQLQIRLFVELNGEKAVAISLTIVK